MPRQVVQTIVMTQGGSVEAYDLDGSVQAIAALGIRADRIHGNVGGRSGRRRDPPGQDRRLRCSA